MSKFNIDRAQYGKIYHEVCGKEASREDCRKGWARWQAAVASGMDSVWVHPSGTPQPQPQDTDHHIVAVAGPLSFHARVSAEHLAGLPATWTDVTNQMAAQMGARFQKLGSNPRARARSFIHASLIEGYVTDPMRSAMMASAIAWLFSNMEALPVDLKDYRLIGYDISYVPGPGRTMFNFRAILSHEPNVDAALAAARSGPLPGWQPPPH